MTNEVKLYKKEGEDKKPYIHVVEEISIFQFAKLLFTLKGVISLARENQSLAELIDYGFKALEGKDEEEEGGAVLSDPLEAFQVLLTEVPDKAIEILSITSGIDRKSLEQQKALVLFDVYDAVIQTNDVHEIVTRAKKSLAVTRNTFKKREFIETKK